MSVQAKLEDGGRRVRVTWPDGTTQQFAARWLYDHCDEARDPVSGQREHGALALERASLVEAAEVEDDALAVRFANVTRRVALRRLRADADDASPITLWETPAELIVTPEVPFADYLRDDAALREVLARVSRFGLAILTGAGPDPNAVERAVERFGFIRETNYGRLFDVRIEPEPGNLAYTDRALELHTDNPYRDPAPTLQLLHAITVDRAGGETLFVDGVAHAEALRREAPAVFETLATTPVRFTYAQADGARWSCRSPVLRLDAEDAVESVRLNHRSLDLAPGDAGATERWYEAYLAYYSRAHAAEAAYARRLAPGEIVIFDNRRLLHGRRGLTSGSPRWLRGCYADVDGLAATLARLARPAQAELAHVD
jgi:gamma-butyrobetaine dioxygenase